MSDLYVKRYDAQDYRLGRQVVHDPRSRNFAARAVIDKSTWHDKAVRIYDPSVNPNQCHGECTGCAESMMLNSLGNRVKGRVLRMEDAHRLYSWASQNDPWSGAWPPDDTGSSGLAAAKAAINYGLAREYRWVFSGADEVVQLVMQGRAVSVGTRWDWDMFNQDIDGRIHLGGGTAGGHQWLVRGYDVDRDWVLGRCWWGGFRDFWIARADLDTLMHDDGDAHVTESV